MCFCVHTLKSGLLSDLKGWCSVALQAQNLTEEVAALEDENRRLSEVIQADQPHNEELLLHVKELQHVSPPHTTTFSPCSATSYFAQEQL